MMELTILKLEKFTLIMMNYFCNFIKILEEKILF